MSVVPTTNSVVNSTLSGDGNGTYHHRLSGFNESWPGNAAGSANSSWPGSFNPGSNCTFPSPSSSSASNASWCFPPNGSVHGMSNGSSYGAARQRWRGDLQGGELASMIAIVFSGLSTLGAIYVIVITVGTLRRARRSAKLGGARKLRLILITGLLASEGLVALTFIGPASMGVVGRNLSDEQCTPVGGFLAAALWWSYGFSIAIAVTTYTALCHPLSRLKEVTERRPTLIVCSILLLGVIQSITWRFAHGFSSWHDFCYYGQPDDSSAELMQILPRLISSFIIIVVYAMLIKFLGRPELSQIYLSNEKSTSSSHHHVSGTSSTAGLTASAGGAGGGVTLADPAPWERVTFPNYRIECGPTTTIKRGGEGDEKGSEAGVQAGPRRKSWLPRLSVWKDKTGPSEPVIEGTLDRIQSLPLDSHVTHDVHSPQLEPYLPTSITISRASTCSDQTLAPALSVSISHQSAFLSPRDSTTEPTVLADISDHSGPRSDSAGAMFNLLAPPVSRSPTKRTLSGGVGPDAETDVGPDIETSSFTGMLRYVPMSVSPSAVTVPPDTEPAAPVPESMAKFMNRETSHVFLWFPISHLIISSVIVVRLSLFNTQNVSTATMIVLELLILLGGGATDVIVFGIVERRTRQRYRQRLASVASSISEAMALRR